MRAGQEIFFSSHCSEELFPEETVQLDAMAMETDRPKRNFELPFRGIPPEIRTMIWQQYIDVAPRIHIIWDPVRHTLAGLGVYMPLVALEYDLRLDRDDLFYITGITFQDLGILFADKKTSAEVSGMLRKETSLLFYHENLNHLIMLSKARSRVTRVTLHLEQLDFLDPSSLEEAMGYLDRFQAGLKLHLHFDKPHDVDVEVLWETGDMRIAPPGRVIEDVDFRTAIEGFRGEETQPPSGTVPLLILSNGSTTSSHMHWRLEFVEKLKPSWADVAWGQKRLRLRLRLLLSLEENTLDATSRSHIPE